MSVMQPKEAVSARWCYAAAVAASLAGAIGLMWIAYGLALDVRQDSARDAARGSVQAISAVSRYYTQTLLPILRDAGLYATHDYHDTPEAVPVPATLIKEIAALGADDAQIDFSTFSRYPFAHRGPANLDAFEEAALDHFAATGAAEYYAIETRADGEVFRYASAMRMGQNCVACHNSNPASTRVGWDVGDLRGATSVTAHLVQPLENAMSRKRLLSMMGVFLLVLLLSGFFFLRARRLTERLREIEAKAQARRLRETALFDSLTKLPNRVHLETVFARGARKAERPGAPAPAAALLHVDLDRFKEINDTLGHAAGDAVLRSVADALRSEAPETAFIARIGGDEFAVILREDAARCSEVAERILERLRRPIEIECHAVRVRASIGVAPIDWSSPLTALANADLARSRAKTAGRDRVELFTPALQEELLHTKRIADEILDGLDADAFFPVYQPQICARSGVLVGVEALARWRHPERGVQAPITFLKIAEDLGVESRIDEAIMRLALRDREIWRAEGLEVPKVSVNVSLRRILDPSLFESLDAVGPSPGVLSFELLESIYLDDAPADLLWRLDALRERGVSIDLDDFGTGHASISAVMQIAPTHVKIDRSLVRDVLERPERRRLLQSVIDIGRALETRVTAEGVETLEHAEVARTLGCDVLQGYGIGKPMPAEALVDFVRGADWIVAPGAAPSAAAAAR